MSVAAAAGGTNVRNGSKDVSMTPIQERKQSLLYTHSCIAWYVEKQEVKHLVPYPTSKELQTTCEVSRVYSEPIAMSPDDAEEDGKKYFNATFYVPGPVEQWLDQHVEEESTLRVRCKYLMRQNGEDDHRFDWSHVSYELIGYKVYTNDTGRYLGEWFHVEVMNLVELYEPPLWKNPIAMKQKTICHYLNPVPARCQTDPLIHTDADERAIQQLIKAF
jgi:hypothetical protein